MSGQQTCGSCKHAAGFDITPTGRFKQDTTARCVVEVPEPVLPESIKSGFGYSWPPSRSYVGPNDGESCAFWEAK